MTTLVTYVTSVAFVSTLTCVYVVAMGYLDTRVAHITVDFGYHGYLGYQSYKCDCLWTFSVLLNFQMI